MWSFFVSKIVSLEDDFFSGFWDTEINSTEKTIMDKKIYPALMKIITLG